MSDSPDMILVGVWQKMLIDSVIAGGRDARLAQTIYKAVKRAEQQLATMYRWPR